MFWSHPTRRTWTKRSTSRVWLGNSAWTRPLRGRRSGGSWSLCWWLCDAPSTFSPGTLVWESFTRNFDVCRRVWKATNFDSMSTVHMSEREGWWSSQALWCHRFLLVHSVIVHCGKCWCLLELNFQCDLMDFQLNWPEEIPKYRWYCRRFTSLFILTTTYWSDSLHYWSSFLHSTCTRNWAKSSSHQNSVLSREKQIMYLCFITDSMLFS